MTAVPRTIATRAVTRRQIEQPLRGNQREPTWQRPPAAVAALLPSDTRRSAEGWLPGPHRGEDRATTHHPGTRAAAVGWRRCASR